MTRYQPLIVATLLACQATLLAVGAARHGPVMDDVAHLVAGISNWQLGRFDLFKVNPPLVRMLAALPVMLAGSETDWESYSAGVSARAEFAVMDDFSRANGPRVVWLVTLARTGLIPVVLLGGCICYRWARDLYGDPAGLLALALWCFCPNVLGNSLLLAADLGATALGVSAAYLFWKWLKEPAWGRTLAAGIALGLAELTKTTWVVLFALWPLLFLVSECRSALGFRRSGKSEVESPKSKIQRPKSEPARACAGVCSGVRNRISQMAAILGLALLCINLGYDFEGSGTRLDGYLFVSRPLVGEGGAVAVGNRFENRWLGKMRVPLPKNYLEGIDLQWHDLEVDKPSYLRGRWQERGWWYWYLYALAVKVPLGTWGLLVLAVGARVAGFRKATGRRTPIAATRPNAGPLPEGNGVWRLHSDPPLGTTAWLGELVVFAPAIIVLVLVSSQTSFSRYLRYALPIFPFGFIWISSIARNIGRKTFVVTAALLAWSVGSSLWYAPHWMSYFNELAGGPMGGPRHLLDAQVEWGQDLLYLKKWLDAHPGARPLGLAFLGPIDPRLAGVEFTLPPRASRASADCAAIAQVPLALKPGWYAVSVNLLYGCPYFARDERCGRMYLDRAYYSYFRRFRPVATAGYSIYIYHLTRQDIQSASLPADEFGP